MKLCKCNNCEGIFEDLNPQVNAKEFPDIKNVKPLKRMKDKDSIFFVCPTCKTDDFLSDDVDNKDFAKLLLGEELSKHIKEKCECDLTEGGKGLCFAGQFTENIISEEDVIDELT